MRCYELQTPGSLDGLVSAERPEPQPGPGEVVVRMRAASLNYRDLIVQRGHYGKLKLPLVPLSDGAGEIAAVGPGVERWKPGMRVAGTFFQDWPSGALTPDRLKTALGGGACDGVLAELVRFREQGVVAVPEHLSYEEAATLPCAALTAWQALVVSGGLAAGETVVTLGTGGVSLFALQFARLMGARVIITSSSDDKLARARTLGAAETINYRTTPQWQEKVHELTGKRGADHVIEVGGAGTFGQSLRATRVGGHVALIGVLSGMQTELSVTDILMKSLRVQGIYVGSREMFEQMNRAIAQHQLKPVIDRVFPFDQVRDAYAHLASGQHFGKVVVTL